MANIIVLEQISECCPEQYWAKKGSHTIGYIRLRWGHLTCDYLPKGRLTDNDIRVYDKTFNERADDHFKGSFDTEEEREYWLSKCKEALLNKYFMAKREITMAIIKSYTSLEQSKKLAEILPHESADMCYRAYREEGGIPDYQVTLCPYQFASWIGVPCWSLAALLGLMPKGEGKDLSLVFGSYDGGYHPLWFCTYEETPTILEICSSDNPIDACVEMIYKLKEKDLL